MNNRENKVMNSERAEVGGQANSGQAAVGAGLPEIIQELREKLAAATPGEWGEA
jgi:hypothetical protein